MISPTGRLGVGLALVVAMAGARPGWPSAQEKASPPETAAYRQNAMPGYALVLRNCLMCHSAEYVLTQPATSSRAYWEATVKKMKKPFGAPYPDEDVAAMVDYLSKTYGADRPDASPGLRGAKH